MSGYFSRLFTDHTITDLCKLLLLSLISLKMALLLRDDL